MKSFLILASGIAIGVGVSWMYHKNKYEELVNEEVESIREHIRNKEEKTVVSDEPIDANEYEVRNEETDDQYEDVDTARSIINYNKYSQSNNTISHAQEMANQYKKPFVVTPDDFASVPGFDTDTFYYYSNDIIVNDNNEPVDDVEGILGMSTLEVKEHFGEHEDDSVYIRNMRLKTDYEVLQELDAFDPIN